MVRLFALTYNIYRLYACRLPNAQFYWCTMYIINVSLVQIKIVSKTFKYWCLREQCIMFWVKTIKRMKKLEPFSNLLILTHIIKNHIPFPPGGGGGGILKMIYPWTLVLIWLYRCIRQLYNGILETLISTITWES